MMPTGADYRTSKLLILRRPAVDCPSVTAEVAGSSPVVPAILPKNPDSLLEDLRDPQRNASDPGKEPYAQDRAAGGPRRCKLNGSSFAEPLFRSY